MKPSQFQKAPVRPATAPEVPRYVFAKTRLCAITKAITNEPTKVSRYCFVMPFFLAASICSVVKPDSLIQALPNNKGPYQRKPTTTPETPATSTAQQFIFII